MFGFFLSFFFGRRVLLIDLSGMRWGGMKGLFFFTNYFFGLCFSLV